MSKKSNLSVKERREEYQKQQQAQQNRMIMMGGGVLAVLVLVFIVWQVIRSQSEGTVLDGERPLSALDPIARNNYYAETGYPEMTIDTAKTYEAVITLEKGGEMRFNLFSDVAPLAVNSFVFLAQQGFFDGVTFHRVLENFMAQGGDPSGTGAGGPGYQFANETSPDLLFDKRGLLAMANAGPDTNSSQFFITFAPAPNLNGNYTIFGELIEGDDVLSTISFRDPNLSPTEPGDVIERIDIVEN